MVIFLVVDTFNLHYSHTLQAGSNIREMLQGDVKGRIYSTDHGIRQSHFQVKFSISGSPDILIHLLPLLRRILAILHLIRSVDNHFNNQFKVYPSPMKSIALKKMSTFIGAFLL